MVCLVYRYSTPFKIYHRRQNVLDCRPKQLRPLVILERGAEINNRSNEYYESALSVASYKGHIDMVRFLLQAGADHLNFALSAASTGGQMEVSTAIAARKFN
ncbi:ankyrin repeat and KH domain-containing protein 1-like [Drosophila albomicans]|uniref:Ankyrin repeat and KH domain-containing protein 1-like n=1 Tax=Drosophila albomicans TaxID=7291 RepID=A0A9C6SYN7_DROAB|nr:ankyrin repeat and KH domain-containing protein 1-like [Drosophila albomicans]